MPYQKGNPGGPGRPKKVVEDASLSILAELFDEVAERAIVENMIANAKRKGVQAADSSIKASTWLWDRKYGKPKEFVEHSGGIELRKGYTIVSPDDWDEAPFETPYDDPAQPGDAV